MNFSLNYLKSIFFKKFILSFNNNFSAVAAWYYSNTFLSWYLIAFSEKLLISNIFVLPVWPTSWHNALKIKDSLVN